MRKSALKDGRMELIRFLNHLEEASDRDIGPIIAVATIIRVNLENQDQLPRDLFDIDNAEKMDPRAKLQLRLATLVRQFQGRKQENDIVGTMVWLHTLRALTFPELRPLGIEMWRELVRGFDHTEDIYKIVEEARDEPLDPRMRTECRLIPNGLGQATQSANKT